MDNSVFFAESKLSDDVNRLNEVKKLEQYGVQFGVTDFAKLSGVNLYLIPNNKKNLWKNKKLNNGTIVWSNYDVSSLRDNYGYSGIKLVFNYLGLKDEVINFKEKNGIQEIIYGEYSQWVVDEECSNYLEELCKTGSLVITGKNYTHDSAVVIQNPQKKGEFDIDIKSRNYMEYEYNGEKYIRIKGRKEFEGLTLSDGRMIENKKPYWIKVEPIVWLANPKDFIAIPKYTLFSRVVACFALNDGVFYMGSDQDKLIDAFSKQIECHVNLFEDTINKMNDINEKKQVKTKVLK